MSFGSKVKAVASTAAEIGAKTVITMACPPAGAVILAKDIYTGAQKVSKSKGVAAAVAVAATALVTGQ